MMSMFIPRGRGEGKGVPKRHSDPPRAKLAGGVGISPHSLICHAVLTERRATFPNPVYGIGEGYYAAGRNDRKG